MDNKKLVELIAREVLKQLRSEGFDLSPQYISSRSVVVLDGYVQGLAQCAYFLDILARTDQNHQIFLGKTDFTEDNFPEKLKSCLINREVLNDKESSKYFFEKDLDNILDTSSEIIIPWLPLATLSRLVSLQPECSVSLLLTRGLLAGKRIWARKFFTHPTINLYQSPQLSPILRRVQGLVGEGKLMGINWLEDGDIEKIFQQIPGSDEKVTGKRLLTAQDVKDFNDLTAKGEIIIPYGTVVTPLARDELRRQKITIRMADVREVK